MIPGVSLIICTYNGSKLLPPTIKHILAQKVDNSIKWEVLFINNASTDNTREVIESSWHSEIPMKVIDEEKKGLINARKRGLSEAIYDIVSFIDDDNWIDKSWINEVYNTFQYNPLIGICGSKNKANYEKQPPNWFKWIEESFAIGTQGNSFEDITNQRGYVWGAGLSLRKEVYFKLLENGFSFFLTGRKGKKLTAGEDTELCYAYILAGYQIWYNDKMILTHYVPAKRLLWSKIVKMFIGFGRAHSVLQIYKHFILNKKGVQKLIFNNTKEFFPVFFKKITGKIKNKEGNGKFLHFIFLKEKLIGTIFNINFLRNYNSINNFRKSVSK